VITALKSTTSTTHKARIAMTRRQLGWLAHLRTTVGLVATEQNEYRRLVVREAELLGLVA